MRDLEGIMCFGIGPSISWLVAGLPIPHLRYFQRLDGSSKGHGNTGRPELPEAWREAQVSASSRPNRAFYPKDWPMPSWSIGPSEAKACVFTRWSRDIGSRDHVNTSLQP